MQDTSLPDKRASMVRAARELLFSITRLMVLADIIDVNNLLNASGRVREGGVGWGVWTREGRGLGWEGRGEGVHDSESQEWG